ncbi:MULTISPECIES: hypothetical protein [unclassified Micromonospora]|uniref:hypothetical protein n=1 Tax=unclassified Micromonospora TaxID=2617518 RepID=UPI00332EF088
MSTLSSPAGAPARPRTPRRTARLALLLGPPAVLALAGLLHPHHLTPDTARQWTALHLALLPVFPLLAAGLLTLLRSAAGRAVSVARVGCYVYAIFYTGLDAIAGIAAGRLMIGAEDVIDVQEQIDGLSEVGGAVGLVGALGFLVAAAGAAVALVSRYGRPAVPGVVVLLVAAVFWLGSHIYWPEGVLTVVAIGTGFALLEFRAVRPAEARGAVDASPA